MPNSTIFILITLFALAFATYIFLKRTFASVSEWIKINLVLLVFGIIGAWVLTPFIIPHEFLRNLPVLTIIPFLTYNIFYLVNELAASFRIGKLAREIIGFFSILAGIIAGSEVINLIGLSFFKFDDIKDAFLVAFFFNTARMIFDHAGLLNMLLRKQKDLKIVQTREAVIQEKMDMLQSKLNPHFLYNSLNSIAGLAMVDGRKTKDMTMALSRLLRYSLNYSEENFASLAEEIEIVHAYFDIEKIRFDNDLIYEVSMDKELEDYLIPRFLLQPLVENCIKHGFNKSEQNHFIKIKIIVEKNELVITIHDNGSLFPEKLTPGYGLKNVNDKLQLLLPGKHSFQITNIPQKQIIITIRELKKRNG